MRSDFDVEVRSSLATHLFEGHDSDAARPFAVAEFASRAGQPAIARVMRAFRASSDRVFAAWLDTTSAGRWLFATASRPMTVVEIDARVGGRFRFVERRRGGVVECAGRYLEIVASRRLAFTLAIDHGPEATVTIEIIPRGNGCRLVLREQPVSPRERERIAGRWTGILYGLGLILDENDPSRYTRS